MSSRCVVVFVVFVCFVKIFGKRFEELSRFDQLLFTKCKGYALPRRCVKVNLCGRVLPRLQKNCDKIYGKDFIETLISKRKRKQLEKENAMRDEIQANLNQLQPKAPQTNLQLSNEIEPEPSEVKNYNVIEDSSQFVLNEMRYAPRITAPPKNITVPPGGTAQFNCISTGAPSPQTIIARVGNMKASNNFQTTTSTSLSEIQLTTMIEIVTGNDEGWYRCSARNANGEDEADAYLEVKDLCVGVICKEPEICQADYNTLKTTCECISDCSISEQSLHSPVCATDCQGYFNVCHMRHQACKRGYKINVMYEGQCESWDEMAVFVRGGTETRVVYRGDKLVLECEVYGTPRPDVTWYRIGYKKEHIKVSSGNLLAFNYSNIDDTSRYICKASNCIHKEVVSLPVKVKVLSAAALQSPQNTNLRTCAVFGDTHISTFDGSYLPVTVQCDYVLAMECLSGEWLIYSRLGMCGQSTCVETVTIYVDRAIIVLSKGWIVAYRSYKLKLTEQRNVQAGAVTLRFDGLYVTATFGSQGGKVKVTWDGFSSALITLDTSHYSTCGLCGNGDGDPHNDLNPSSLFSQSESLSVEEFSRSWRVDTWGVCSRVMKGPTVTTCSSIELKAAQSRCRSILFHTLLSRCDVDRTLYMEACVHDICSNRVPWVTGYPTECQIGMVYLKICSVTTNLGETLYKAGCPTRRETQPIIVEQGCPQENVPYRS